MDDGQESAYVKPGWVSTRPEGARRPGIHLMIVESRVSIHFGVNFVLAPQPVLDSKHNLSFQGALADAGLTFTNVQHTSDRIVLGRDSPPLQVDVLHQPGPPVGQLRVLAPQPKRTLKEFADEADMARDAFQEAWPGNLQIVQRDCTIRHLYDVNSDHSFRWLWEDRLEQTQDSLAALGRPIHGGGLSFVFLPTEGEVPEPGVQVKIESFLADPSKLYVDVALTWTDPTTELAPLKLLEETERYATTEVVAFIMGETR